MKIDKILSGIRQSQETSKEASDRSTSASAPVTKVAETTTAPRDALVGALNEALSTQKMASDARSPVSDVMKVAEEMAGVEHDARVKEAQVMGAAFADAFVARLGQWQEKAASLNTQPVAAATSTFDKLAYENPGLVAQASGLGYSQTKAALDKQADDAHAAGFNDTVVAIHKTASVEFLKGAAIMSNVLDAAIQG